MKSFYLISFVLISFFAHSQTVPLDSLQLWYEQQHYEQIINATLAKEEKEEAMYLVGLAYQQLGQIVDSRTLFLKLYERDTLNASYLYQLAKIQNQVGQSAQAFQYYQKLHYLDTSNLFYLKKYADQAVDQQNYFLALSLYEKAVAKNVKDLESVIALIRLYNALQLFEKSVELINETSSLYHEIIQFQSLHLRTAYKTKNYELTFELAEDLINRGDSGLLNYKIAGTSAYFLEKYDRSIYYLGEIVEQVQNNELMHYYLGIAHRENNNHEEAKKHLDAAISKGISKNMGIYYTQQAINYEEEGNYAEAIKLFKIAYQESKDQILLYHLARNYDEFYKDKTVALKYYQKYLEYSDTANEYLQNYSRYRIKELKGAAHFDLDTL